MIAQAKFRALSLLQRGVRLVSGRGWRTRLPWLGVIQGRFERALYPGGIIRMKVGIHEMVIDARDQGLGPALVHSREYEPFESSLVASAIRPGMTVLDIGAHCGYYTLIAARAVGPSGRVIAFEPDPATASLLRKNIELNKYSNVTVVEAAVSDHEGTAELFRDSDYTACSSLAAQNTFSRAPSTAVAVTTLDRYVAENHLPSPDLIKIDVQGAEARLFAGGQHTLNEMRGQIFMEFWPHGLKGMGADPEEFLDRLALLGFTVNQIDENERTLTQIVTEDIMAICAGAGGTAHVNLLLRLRTDKPAT